MPSKDLFPIPIVTRDINDPVEYVGNVYDKAGWVLHMLRSQLGDEAFSAPSNIISRPTVFRTS